MKKLLLILFLCSLCYADSGRVLSDSNDYYISSPYDGNDLRELQYVQSNDVEYLVHPDYAPQKLSRYDHNDWTIDDVDWKKGPFLDENTDEIYITPSNLTGDVNLVATADIFDGNMVGAQWRIKQRPENTSISGTVDSNETTSYIIVEGDYLLSLNGTWYGKVALQRSDDRGLNWEDVYIRNHLSATADNIEYSGIEAESDYIYRVEMSDYIAGSCKYNLIAYDTYINIYMKIKSYTDANEVVASIVSPLLSPEDTNTARAQIQYESTTESSWEVGDTLTGENTNTALITGIVKDPEPLRIDLRKTSLNRTDTVYYTMVSGDDFIVGETVTNGTDEYDLISVTSYDEAFVIESSATTKWAEGAWSDYRGWPRAICFYQNRLFLAGTEYLPNTIWCSQSADYENMEVGTLDTDAIVYEVAAAKQNPIMWLQDSKGIIAGTSNSIIRVFSQSNTSTLTPATIGSERQSETGSCSIASALSGNSIIYVDRNRRKVRDILYDIQSDGFISPDLTIYSDNITEPNILEMAWQKRPDPIGWFIKGDGNMVTLTYNPYENIIAWGEIATDGNFVSICVIPGEDEDEVWVAVERDSNDSVFIEKFHNQDWTNDVWFVDSGLVYDGNETDTLTGLGYLEGKSVQVYNDANGYIGDYTVSSGSITLDVNVTEAIAGLDYMSRIKTFPIEKQTSSIGLPKNIQKIDLCLFESEGGRYGFKSMFDIQYPTYTTDFYTGQVELNFMSGSYDEVYVILDQNEPLPLGITGIALTKYEFNE